MTFLIQNSLANKLINLEFNPVPITEKSRNNLNGSSKVLYILVQFFMVPGTKGRHWIMGERGNMWGDEIHLSHW